MTDTAKSARSEARTDPKPGALALATLNATPFASERDKSAVVADLRALIARCEQAERERDEAEACNETNANTIQSLHEDLTRASRRESALRADVARLMQERDEARRLADERKPELRAKPFEGGK